jgi:hypothetical protein
VHSLISIKDQPIVKGFITGEYLPVGFLQEIYIDRSGFDRQHYRFQYAGREFLGEVRCLVFNVEPLPNSRQGRFQGRIWAEDETYTIVRFSGAFVPMHRWEYFPTPHPDDVMYPHFDSWRLNVQPGLWLPSYIFNQENNLADGFTHRRGFKSQTRLWGYHVQNARHQSEFGDLSIESPTPLHDGRTTDNHERAPVKAQWKWSAEAEMNALDTLERMGLLAAPGEVDRTLNRVVINLEVVNNLDLVPEVHCRVLTTSNLEMFSIGYTIILSRGLIDVVPDEATLATMLAQGLANVMASKPGPDKYGFGDVVQVSSATLMKRFESRERLPGQQSTSEEALALLKNSPYSDTLGNAGLFLKQLHEESPALSELINPNLGNSVYLASELMNSAAAPRPDRSDQIAALPIGGRIRLDPWNDEAELLKAEPVRPVFGSRKDAV